MLGDLEFADIPVADRFKVMGGLSASALPVASPGGAGILGIPFLFAFPGGFDLSWGTNPGEGGSGGTVPSITFFGDLVGQEAVIEGLAQVPCQQLPSGLVTVTLTVNGQSVPALLDTGSPITVLNAAASKLANVEPATEVEEPESGNLFARFAAGIKAQAQAAQAAASGDVLRIMGASGPVDLRRAPVASMALGDAVLCGADAAEGPRCYVGELPGLALLGGLGADAGPAAVLGADMLRMRPRLVMQDSKVYV